MSKQVEQIENLLPQTQCGLCNYPGCKPYAEAIVHKNERIDLCLPGGQKILLALAQLRQEDPKPLLADMMKRQKPPAVAKIREVECIGCTKCIQACPVDAIIGVGKHMHSIISTECTGCELCIEPCPVDCIDLISLAKMQHNPELAKQRYQQRNHRLKQREQIKQDKLEQKRLQLKKNYINAAIKRVKYKRSDGITDESKKTS